ncbi:MAG: tetratricopeptide repeat protein [Candidatus Omnitrophica bacterium]|nr:tetratricopeptide repeat protein [Candidatus Omnitrophota bacterium]
MRPEDKKYILENIGKRPVSEIARDLSIKEKKVRKFLEKEQKKPKSQEPKVPVNKIALLLPLALIAILGLVIYANSLHGEFLWDDFHLVKQNKYITEWSGLPKVFTGGIGKGAGRTYHFYRPLQLITYMIDYNFWGLNVFGYHLSNVLIHILVAFAVYWFINVVFRDRLLALFSGLLFVVHPVHVEAVSYIAGRADPLAILFLLVSFIFYIRFIEAKKASLYVFCCLSYILAILSKEGALFLPVLLLVYHYAFGKKLEFKSFAPLLAVALFYIILRFTALRSLLMHVDSTTTLAERIPGFFVAIVGYLRLLVLPFDLHLGYGGVLFRWSYPQALLGVVLVIILLSLGIVKRKSNSLISFSILWFFTALLPFSNIYPINAYMAEHWLYLSSLGFFLILADVLCRVYRKVETKSIAVFCLVAILSFYSYLTIKQNRYWREPLNFYQQTIKYVKDNPTVYNNLGIIYGDMGDMKKAESLFKASIELEPTYADPYFNLGRVYIFLNQKDKAIATYEKAIELYPDAPYAGTYYNLGYLYDTKGNKQKAVSAYKKAIEVDPYHLDANNNLAILFSKIGKDKEAIEFFKRVIQINPDYASAYSNLAVIYHREGMHELALKYYNKAESLGISNPQLREEIKRNLP